MGVMRLMMAKVVKGTEETHTEALLSARGMSQMNCKTSSACLREFDGKKNTS